MATEHGLQQVRRLFTCSVGSRSGKGAGFGSRRCSLSANSAAGGRLGLWCSKCSSHAVACCCLFIHLGRSLGLSLGLVFGEAGSSLPISGIWLSAVCLHELCCWVVGSQNGVSRRLDLSSMVLVMHIYTSGPATSLRMPELNFAAGVVQGQASRKTHIHTKRAILPETDRTGPQLCYRRNTKPVIAVESDMLQ